MHIYLFTLEQILSQSGRVQYIFLFLLSSLFIAQVEREIGELQVNCNCRCHAERHRPEAKKNERQFPQHLTRTKDIIALRAKRLNETGKVYFLESTYTQITVTFLAALAGHIHTMYCSEKDLWDTYQDKTKLLTCKKREITGRNQINQRKEEKKTCFLGSI